MIPNHHPGDDLLWEYAAGAQREPVALVIATHLALCPACRDVVASCEAIAGALLDEVPTDMTDNGTRERVFAQLDKGDIRVSNTGAARKATPVDLLIPRPLRDYVSGRIEDLVWQERRGGPAAVHLLGDVEEFDTRLLRIRAGTTMPRHRHEGNEYTLVLSGGFSDHTGHYVRGDVAICDNVVDHQPIADPGDDCICLAVVDAPLRLSGPFGRLLNPFVKY